MKYSHVFLLILSISLIVLGLNQLLEFIPFENQKNNSLILSILSLITVFIVIWKTKKEK
jgi:hypothetical protein